MTWKPDRDTLAALFILIRDGRDLESAGEVLGVCGRTISRHAARDPRIAETIAEAKRIRAENRPHGVTRYQAGCRCEVCTTAHRERMRGWATRVAGSPPEHGTVNAYTNYGCRCGPCKAAQSEENRRQYEKRKARSDQAPHGTVSAYTNWGCRCLDCWRAYSANYRSKKAGVA
jgi:hypothetical protein